MDGDTYKSIYPGPWSFFHHLIAGLYSNFSKYLNMLDRKVHTLLQICAIKWNYIAHKLEL